MRRLLITGAAGAIGSTLRAGLRGVAETMRLTDIRPLGEEQPGEETVVGDLHNPAFAQAVTRDVDCLVHLAGVPREDAWEPILRNNIEAVFHLFEAARLNGVRRVIFASSNHVTGFYPVEQEVDPSMPVRPDSRYGVSKVFGEALGRLYSDKHGLEVACLRIGSFRPRPASERQLATWISPRDLTTLVRRCITAPPFHFLVLYGVSANTRNRWRDEVRTAIGFEPQDSAEDYEDAVPPASSGDPIAERFHGGDTCAAEFSAKQTSP